MAKSKSGSRKGGNVDTSLKSDASNQATGKIDNSAKTSAVEIKDDATKINSTENLNSLPPPDITVNPVFAFQQALDNKLRNLNKRITKLEQLKTTESQLASQQRTACLKLEEVNNQIEFVKELQALTQKQLKLYKKAVRRREYEEVEKRSKSDSVSPSVVSTNEGDRNSPDENKSEIVTEENTNDGRETPLSEKDSVQPEKNGH